MPRAWILSASRRENGSPQRVIVRTLGGSGPSRSSSDRAEGTVLISSTSPAAGSSGRASGFSATINVPPQARVPKNSNTDRSKQTEVEKSTPPASSGKFSADQLTKAARLRWVTPTALGRPVEPEV